MVIKSKFKPLAVLACTILVVLALFCIGSTEVSAETLSGYCGGEGDGTNLQWSLDTETGVFTVTGKGAMKSYWGNDYTGEPRGGFSDSRIRHIVIGNGVTDIGAYAFEGCSGLESVVLGDSVTGIGWMAFIDCYNLESIFISDSVTWISPEAIGFRGSLKEAVFESPNDWYGEDHYSPGTGIYSFVFSDPKSAATILNEGCWELYRTHTHSFGEGAYVAPTCTTVGGMMYPCECGYTRVRDAVPDFGGHVYSDWIIDEAATCSKSGKKHIECTVCGEVLAEEIVVQHTLTDWITQIKPTCEGEGKLRVDCSVCGKTVQVQTVAPIGHRYTVSFTENSVIQTCVNGCGTMHEQFFVDEMPTYSELVQAIGELGVKKYCYIDLSGAELDKEYYSTDANYPFGNRVAFIVRTNRMTVKDNGGVDGVDRYVRMYAKTQVNSSHAYTNLFLSGTPKGGDSVFEFAIRLGEPGADGKYTESNIQLIDRNTTASAAGGSLFYVFGSMTENGAVRIGEIFEIPLSRESFTRIAFAYHFDENLFDVYVNGIPEYVGLRLFDDTVRSAQFQLEEIRMLQSPNNQKVGLGSSYDIADVIVYGGRFPLAISGSKPSAGCEHIYSDGEKCDNCGKNVGVVASGECGATGYTVNWVLTDDGVLTVSGEGNMRNYTDKNHIPWLTYKDGIRSVVIKDGVTSVGSMAFYQCENLTSVTTADSVTVIGDRAFKECYSLSDISISDGVTELGAYAFERCDSLESIVIPDGVTDIGYGAFINCAELKSITLGSAVESISSTAFYGCYRLVEIVNRSELELVAGKDSYGGIALNAIEIRTGTGESKLRTYNGFYFYVSGGKNYLIGTVDGDAGGVLILPMNYNGENYSVWHYAFYGYGEITEAVIGKQVLFIGRNAFGGCSKLMKIAVPNSISEIFENAFSECTQLSCVVFESKWGWTVKASKDAETALTVSPSVLGTPDNAATYITSVYGNYYWYSDHVHYYADGKVTAPTCTEAGYTTYFCECGESMISDEVQPLGHVEGAAQVQNFLSPTCTADGSYDSVVTCTVCSVELGRITVSIPTAGHRLGDAVLTAPTCITEGYITVSCNVCSSSFDSRYHDEAKNYLAENPDFELGTIPHDYTATIVPPSCIQNGYTLYVCSFCGDSYAENETVAVGHRYDLDAVCSVCDERIDAPSEGECGEGVCWRFVGGGELMIFGNGVMDDLTAGLTPWNAYKDILTKVTVSEGVLYVGANAFNNFRGVTEIALPASLLSIGEYAFAYTRGVRSITLPSALLSIGRFAFHSSGLKSVKFTAVYGWYAGAADATSSIADPSVAALYLTVAYSATVWGRDTSDVGEELPDEEVIGGSFSWSLGSSGILKVSGKGDMPDYNSDTMPWASYRSMIVRIEIGEGITSVGRCAFYGCTALRSVSLPSTVGEIKEYAFYGCGSLTEITVPAEVGFIGKFAFRRSGLSSVSFETPYGWSSGGTDFTATEVYGLGAAYLTKTYYKCDWVRDLSAEPEEIDRNFFAGGACNSYTRWVLTYTDDSKTALKLTVSGSGAMPEYGTGAAPWYAYLDRIVEIEVEAGVTSVGRCAFYGLKNATKVALSEGIVKIGDYAFNGCKSLTEIVIPESVASIGKDAFGKTGLGEIPAV